MRPAQSKKQLATNEDALNWEEINKVRKATKGCLTIMKDKINAQFEKRPQFDMSFGLGKEESTLRPKVVEEKISDAEILKKREETLTELRK